MQILILELNLMQTVLEEYLLGEENANGLSSYQVLEQYLAVLITYGTPKHC
jgi:hypothetical protein